MDKTITFRGTRRELYRLLKRVPALMKKAGTGNPVLVRVGNAVLGKVHRAFMQKATGGADEANLQWPPLAKSTVAYKKRRGFFTEILRERGPLGDSLEPTIGLRLPQAKRNQVFRVRRGSVEVGTSRKGALAHHLGTRHLPQRRLWPEPDKWPQSWWTAIQEAVMLGAVEIITQLVEKR